MKALFASLLAVVGTSTHAETPPPVGDHAVTYRLAPDVESRYRLFVPEDWRPGNRWPLVVMLHGGGSNEDGPFDRDPAFRQQLFAEARAHHFILLSPRGHKGGWGARVLDGGTGATPRGTYRWPPASAISGPPPQLTPRRDRDTDLAQRDVIETVSRVTAQYGVLDRPFLMGNSMGGQGTLHLAQAEPNRWCAISPSDGPFDPATYPYQRITGVRAALFIHGDDDRVAPIESMTAIAGGFDRAGVPTRLVVVPGGTHNDSWRRTLSLTFAFFERYSCDSSGKRSR